MLRSCKPHFQIVPLHKLIKPSCRVILELLDHKMEENWYYRFFFFFPEREREKEKEKEQQPKGHCLPAHKMSIQQADPAQP